MTPKTCEFFTGRALEDLPSSELPFHPAQPAGRRYQSSHFYNGKTEKKFCNFEKIYLFISF